MFVTVGLVAYLALLIILVLSQDNQKRSHISLAIFAALVAAWVASIALLSTSIGSSVMFTRLIFLEGLWSSLTLAWFGYEMLTDLKIQFIRKRNLNIALIASIGMSLVTYLTPLIVQSVRYDGKSIPTPEPGLFYWLFVLLVIFIFIDIGWTMLRALRSTRGVIHAQLKTVSLTLIAAGVVALMTNIIFPQILNNTITVAFFPLAIIVLMTGLTYAIVYNRLFDIKLAVVRTLAYGLSLLAMAGIYFGLVYVASWTVLRNVASSVSSNPINILLALALAFMFQPIKTFFDKTTNQIFFHDRYNSEDFYARLSEVLTTTTELKRLLERAAIEVANTMKAEQAFFVVLREGSKSVIAGTPQYSGLPTKDIEYLVTHNEQFTTNVIVTELLASNTHLYRLLSSHKIAILLPLKHQTAIVGYLALGEHQAASYTSRDIKTLTTVSDELVIAIENSLSVQEVKDVNVHLEQRIEMATAELRTTNARLKRLDAAKDEFLSMASHQLRTPLTSIKGYLSMMVEGDLGKLNDMQKKVALEAFASSERMVHLIHDFLNVSRLQTGKFALEKGSYDLAALVKDEVASLKRVAEIRSLTLNCTSNTKKVVFEFDDMKIRQVVMNFIDNAIFYSPKGTAIEVVLTKSNGMIEFVVKDQGIGVPKAEQAQLFSKFFRATNARQQRPDGTGVGIFLAKKIILAHGGEMIFKSKEGRGSTFGFRLPLKQPKTVSD